MDKGFKEDVDDKKVAEDLKQIFDPSGDEEKQFRPSYIAKRLLELEEEGGRIWDYVPERDQFFCYREDRGVWEEAEITYLKKECRRFLRAQKSSWDRRSRVREVTSAIKAHLADRATKERFNAGQDPDLDHINLKNGTLDWKRDELLDHSPENHSLFQLPVIYDPEARCPRWRKALEEWIPEEDTRLFLQEFTGYCLIPDISRHKAVILFGTGRNGKSTFLETLASLFGERNLSHIELSRLTRRFEVAHLKDKLVNLCSDLDPTYIKRTGIIKTIVAGEPIRGEHKFKPSFDFKPVVRLMFSCNQLPGAKDKSVAWYRRFEFVKFPNEFEPGEDSYDRHLKQKLIKEKSGILNWALEGLKRLEKQDQFTGSEALKEAKRAYKLQNDSVQAFLDRKVREQEGSVLPRAFLYKKYKEFCKRSGVSSIHQQKFTPRLSEEFGFVKVRPSDVRICGEHEDFRCEKCPPEEFKEIRKRCWKDIELV